MALRDQVVDVFFSGPDQYPSDRTGVSGRLTDLRNAELDHTDPAAPGKPQFLNLKQRRGLRSLSLSGHNSSGVTTSPSWASPRLLTSTGNGAPLAINRGLPRVYDGTDWTDYASSRVLTNKTTARPVYTGQSVAQAPDKSWISGVTCRTWTEVTQASNISETAVTTVIASFRADNGAWIRSPFVQQAAGAAGNRTMARTVTDGTNFWIFATDPNGGNPKINIKVYDTNGQQLASNNIDLQWDDEEPGYWDVQRRPGTSTILLVQPNGNDPDADNNVKFTACSYAAAVITLTSNNETNIHCNGPVAWLSNIQDSFNYLATTNFDAGDTVRLWAYRVEFSTPNYISGHAYDFGVTLPVTPDTLIGFTETSTDATPAHKNVVVSAGIPAIASSYGAPYDPALRYIKSWRVTWANVTTVVRETHSVCQVSRAFLLDSDYYAMTYYQSGSGEGDPELEEVTITPSDYFHGAPEQDLVVNSSTLVTGSPQLIVGSSVFTSLAAASQNIQAGDEVINTVTPAGLAIPAGRAALRWTFTNLSGGALTVGGHLNIDGNTDYPPVNTGQWEIIAMGGPGPSFVFYTLTTSTADGTIPDITFTTSGTAEVISYTQFAMPVDDIYFHPATLDFLPQGTIEVSGNSFGGNNDTFTIFEAFSGAIKVLTTTQQSTSDGFTAELTPAAPNRWGLPGNVFDDSYIGTLIQIADSTVYPANNGQWFVTDVPTANSLDTDNETALVPAYFGTEIDAKIVLTGTALNPYEFGLQSVTFDATYIGATISWADPVHPENAGLYKITQIVDTNIVKVDPISTVGTPKNELLEDDPQTTITILKAATTFPQVQPQWFITPIGDVTTAQTGNLELGLAYADWRREGAASTIGQQNPYLLHVSSPQLDNDGMTIDLPFRAVTVSEESATAIGGLISLNSVAAAVIGVKEFKIHTGVVFGVVTNPNNTSGTACNGLLPGPMAAVYDGGAFVEAGILVGPEQPTLEEENEASAPALKAKQQYQYIVCHECIDSKGNRIWTAPSPPLTVTLTGGNTSFTLSGRLPIPLSSSGLNQASSLHYGLSNRPMIVLSIYRTCQQNGLSTTAHYKITDDLAPNAVVPVSSSNASGFSFPDEFTWTYVDENTDAIVLSNEKLYTDQGNLPRFHPPAFHNGAQGWQERDWLNAYDGAIWFSGPGNEGESPWFTPLFRVPAPFEPTAVGNLESFLAGFAIDSKWYLPAFRPPVNNTLSAIPAWQRLPLEGGCTGLVIPVRGGVAYSSNFGGVWYLSRALQDEWTSRDYIDSLDGKTITALAVDAKQRLYACTNTTDVFVFNQIAKRWSRWLLGDGNALRLAAVCNGVIHFSNNSYVCALDSSISRDVLIGVNYATPLGFTGSDIDFGNVSGVKLVRQFQLRGTWKGDHNLLVTVSTADQNPDATDTEMQPFTPDPDKPYVIDMYPLTEEASGYTIEVDADFTGITVPDDSFEIDVISAMVAVDGRAGVNRSTQEISNSSS